LVAIYLVAMLWLGLWFRKSKLGVDYFLGGRRFGSFSLSMSTMATQLSAVSFISAPAFVGLRPGGGMHFLTFEFGVPLAMIVLMAVIGPMLYRSGVLSVYTFLEQRFGRSTRLLLAGLFVVMRTLGSGIAINMMCVVLTSLTGIAFWQIVALLGVVSVIYSLEGGMKAVVYSEVAQMAVMVLGILLIITFGLYHIGGWSGLEAHVNRDRLQVLDFKNFGFDGREFGFWPMVIGGFFLYISYYGTDQTQAQRALSARDEGTLRRMLLFNGLFRFPVTVCYCLGGLILGAFAMSNTEFGSLIPVGKPDLMIPVFVSHYLPHGVIGIIVVALIAAGMSSYSATLNSVSAVVMEDFVSRFVTIPKERYVTWSKRVAMVLGGITLAVGFVADRIAPTAIEAINKVGSLVYGPILGIFLLAAIGRWIRPSAANIAVVTGLAANLYLWIFCKNVFWLWWNVSGTVVTVSVGIVLSLLLRVSTDAPVSFAGFIHARPGREARILLIYFISILAFAFALPRLITSG